MQEPASSLLGRLLREREELRAQIAAQPVPEVDQMTYGSQAEAASDVFEQERALSLRQHLEARLRAVEEAIERAEQGEHGVCQQCGQPIPAERLQILPEATLCVACQRKTERRR